MAEKISARGGRALLFPTIETGCILGGEERDSLLEKLKISTWVIFTSQKAVACFVEILGENMGEYLEAKYVAAVGGKTRDALNRLGVNCSLVGREGSRALGVELSSMASGKDLVFYPRAKKGREELIQLFDEQGIPCFPVDLYDTVAPTYLREELDEILSAPIDVATFTSPSTFLNFLALAGKECAERFFKHVKIAVIGKTTASSVKDAGYEVAIMPPTPDIDSMLDEIWRFFSGERDEKEV